jgi:hypothetical protein
MWETIDIFARSSFKIAILSSSSATISIWINAALASVHVYLLLSALRDFTSK